MSFLPQKIKMIKNSVYANYFPYMFFRSHYKHPSPSS
ncbi:unnamed protein product [Coregonus sp. 'balchen']|nr:unnamed protein product [Coregonus sp. 'balchen']